MNVNDKKKNQLELISRYIEWLKESKNKDEDYKWLAISNFQKHWNVNAPDFEKMFLQAFRKRVNLFFKNSWGFISKAVKYFPEKVKEMFNHLFDETKPLDQRIEAFQKASENLLANLKDELDRENLNHQQDERTISVYLSMRYPDKYYLYKYSFYEAYCNLIGEEIASARNRYQHYLRLADDFKDQIIKKDSELLEIHKTLNPDNSWDDTNLIVQNILFTMLEQNPITDMNYSSEIPEKLFKPEPQMNNYPLNQIFFGPPGTGKTFNAVNSCVEILQPNFNLDQPRNFIKTEFERLRKAGQIEFVTFHQSMSYEDFVEGIKPYVPEVPEADEDNNESLPSLLYKIEDGIFKRLCTRARTGESQKIDFDELWDKFAAELLASKEEVVFRSVDSELKLEKEISTSNSFKIRFKKSWDETAPEGKSIFHVGKETIRNIFNERINLADPELKKWVAIRDIVGSGRATTFYAVYRSFFDHAGLERMFSQKENALPFVLVIDEINRGNISQIFGELITLIEDDKRQGKPEALEAVLPYSKSKFSVPQNIYLIGTMNTADRSIEALDTALRRRFTFVEMAPKPELISEVGKSKGEIDGIDLVKLLTTINERIEKLIDKDHQIGHSYFLDIASLKELKLAFKNKVIPLLEEYFYGDFGKIGLVLGSGFVIQKKKSDFSFADFEGFDGEIITDLKERKVFEITSHETWSVEDFIKIYRK